MGTGQTMPVITTGNSLENADTLSNVATNKADVAAQKAANVDNKDIFPNSATMQHLSAADAIIHGAFKSGSLDVGAGGVSISSAANGSTPSTGILMSSSAFQLIKAGEAVVTLNGSDGSATFKGTIQAGSSISGTMTAGTIAVGAGGVTIGNASAGICISSNQIFCKVGGVTTVLIDGATGVITALKFSLTSDSSSTVNLSAGSITIGGSASIGGTTASTVVSNAAQGPTAYTLASGKTVTFAQASAPTALAIGDLWVDTDGGNKLYRAHAVGNSHWDEVTDDRVVAGGTAIQPGGGVYVDGSKNITTIDLTGINIYSDTTDGTPVTARTQITSAGMAIYNSAGTCTVQADHTNGVWVNNLNATAGVTERVSLAYDGHEVGYLCTSSATAVNFDNFDGHNMYIHSYEMLNLWSEIGDITMSSGVHIGTDGPRITSGAAPTEGDTTTEPLGSILLGTGGSLWLCRYNSTAGHEHNEWTLVHTHAND